MDKLTVLRSARKLLSDPKRWGKNHFAKANDDGERCYCALGAIRASVGRDDLAYDADFPTNEARKLNIEAANELAKTVGLDHHNYVPEWNDWSTTSYEDVMAAFSATCERVFAEQQAEKDVMAVLLANCEQVVDGLREQEVAVSC